MNSEQCDPHGLVAGSKPEAGLAARTSAPDVVIVHNHPIHYKELLFAEMKELGLDFEVLFVSRTSTKRNVLELDPAKYAFRVGHQGAYENHPRVRTARFVWSALNQLNPRVVIISGYYDIAGWTAWVWAEVSRRPKILWNETNLFDHRRPWYREALKRLLVRRFDLAHVYGKSNKDYLIKLGLPPERVLIKRAVADTEKFKIQTPRPKRRPEAINLLFVGRLAREKNLELLIRALAGLKQDPTRPRLVLSVIGYGPEEQKLKQEVQRLGLGAIVNFEGAITQEDLPGRYGEADAFILPSTYEPWGLVVLEAMLCGLPALVSTQCGCERDLVTPSTGWSFSPTDEHRLTSLLRELSDMPRSLLEKMGTEASQHSSSYTPRNCATIVNSTAISLKNQLLTCVR